MTRCKTSGWRCHGGSGVWTVVGLLLLGIVAAVIAVTWWSQMARPAAPGGGASGAGTPGAFDEAAAKAAVAELSEPVNTAIGDGRAMSMLADVKALAAQYPQYGPARRMLGLVYLGAGHYEVAYPELIAALGLLPADERSQLEPIAGTVAMKLGKLDDAERHYQNTIAVNAYDLQTRLLLAQLYTHKAQYDLARDTLLAALRVDATSHRAYAQLADVYARQGKLNLAMDEILKALERTTMSQRPDRVKYTRTKATLLRRLNKPDESLQVLATSLRPHEQMEPAVMAEMADALAMQGKFDEAARLYQRKIELDPTDADAAAQAAHWSIKAAQNSADAAGKAQFQDDARRMISLIRSVDPGSAKIAELEAALGK
ncbi:MAG: tetratricopeptide repeat protein [Phycisphaeraceae bacterium]